MIKTLEVGNFKAFGKKQRFPLAPITLLFGPNSAGKSSLIHSIALIHEAQRSGNLNASWTQLGGSAIDLGGFGQYVFRRVPSNRVEWDIEIGETDIGGNFKQLFRDATGVALRTTFGVAIDDIGNPIRGAKVGLETYQLDVDGVSLLRMSRRADGSFRLDTFNTDHPITRAMVEAMVAGFTTTAVVSDQDYATIGSVISDIVSHAAFKAGNFLPARLSNAEVSAPEAMFPIGRQTRREDLTEAINYLLPRFLDGVVQSVNTHVIRCLESLVYLGPFRTYPSRHFIFTDEHSEDWLSGGGFAWNVIRENAEVRSRLNRWLASERLQTPYELEIRRLVSPRSDRALIAAEIDELLPKVVQQSELDEASSALAVDSEVIADRIGDIMSQSTDGFDDLVLVDRRTETIVSHRDVGIGVSQSLPVLVASFASDNKLIAIEQPELHLHPALAAELGDVFIEAALGGRGNAFVLETHSEHLMLRILRRVRETADGTLEDEKLAIAPTDVSVLYVAPTTAGSIVYDIPITEAGEFAIQWPNGFFPERAMELF